MRTMRIAGALAAILLMLPAAGQPGRPTALWMGIERQLSGTNGARYFESKLKGAALPPLKGTLVSTLIDAGVSRVVLEMPGSERPDVALVVHNGPAKLKTRPAPGETIEFSGVAADFSARPFLLTFDVDTWNLRGLDFASPSGEGR